MTGSVESVKEFAIMKPPGDDLGHEVYTAAEKDAIFGRILKRERDTFQGWHCLCVFLFEAYVEMMGSVESVKSPPA